MKTELKVALAEIKFGYEIDQKTTGDLVDYAEEVLTEHDALILAIAKASVMDRLIAAAQAGSFVRFDADLASTIQAEIGLEVGRILKPEIDRRAEDERTVPEGFRP